MVTDDVGDDESRKALASLDSALHSGTEYHHCLGMVMTDASQLRTRPYGTGQAST
jgi:hypothetical protein